MRSTTPCGSSGTPPPVEAAATKKNNKATSCLRARWLLLLLEARNKLRSENTTTAYSTPATVPRGRGAARGATVGRGGGAARRASLLPLDYSHHDD